MKQPKPAPIGGKFDVSLLTLAKLSPRHGMTVWLRNRWLEGVYRRAAQAHQQAGKYTIFTTAERN